MKIVSLFDGMACGMLAMLGAGVEVDEYYAYEIDKYAVQTATHNFPNIIECGDVFKADFTQYKDVDFIVGGSPCVPAGSKIKTDKGYKNIEDVMIGDMVLTHNNRYRPVSRTYKRTTNHLYHIKYSGNDTLDITGNHPVYVYRNNKFEFIRTDELTVNDYVCININQNNCEMNYSDDILWLTGRTVADGYYSPSKHSIVIAVSKAKTKEFESHLTGLHYYVCHQDRPAPEYVIKSADLLELYSYFGNKKALDKEFPETVLDLCSDKLKYLFDGYISGDGFRRKDRPNTVMWSSSSKNLILSMGLITAKLFGKYPTTTIRRSEFKELPSGYCLCNKNYNSQISITNRENPDIKIIEDKLCIRIKSINKENIATDVYNLETAEDHSYTVNNIIVHNCTYWSIAQKNNRETEASGLGWELFSQYARALKEIKPQFFIYENNKSMSKAIRESITEAFGFDAICINSALVSAQNRQRLYWVGKRNEDGTYSKVDVQQPADRGILLKDILDSGIDLTSRDKSFAYTTRCNGAIPEDTIKRNRHTMIAEPIGETKDGKSYCLTAGYSNGSGENIGNYAAHTLEKGCKSMVAEPVNTTNEGKAQCIRATCYKDGIRNMVGNNIDKRTCVAEPIRIPRYGNEDKSRPVSFSYAQQGLNQVDKNCFPTNPAKQLYDYVVEPIHYEELSEEYYKGCADGSLVGMIENISVCRNGKQPSQQYRVYSCDSKSVCVDTDSRKHYMIPYDIDFNDSGKPIKATDQNGKEVTIYEVHDNQITIKGKHYPIKLNDGYYIIRKLSINEYKRLQTVPEWYEFPVSNSQAYKMLGNGWTVEVIVHLIKSCLTT